MITNNKEAIFKIGNERPNGEITTKNGDVGFIANDKLSKFFYANETVAYHRFLTLNWQEVIYSDAYPEKTKWTINNDQKKKIGTYDCTQAKTMINGRSYTAWFTFDVPVKFGPLKLHQLPGLIVEAMEDDGFLKITLVSIYKNYEPEDFNASKQYFLKQKKMMNYHDYETLMVKDEKNGRIKDIAFVKEQNYESGSVEFLDDVVIDGYLDIPKNLKSELSKLH